MEIIKISKLQQISGNYASLRNYFENMPRSIFSIQKCISIFSSLFSESYSSQCSHPTSCSTYLAQRPAK